MPTVADRLSQIVESLTGVGLRATADPGKVNPPSVWVTLSSVDIAYLSGQCDAVYDVVFIVPDYGTIPAVSQLEEMVSTAHQVLAFETTLEAIGLNVPSLGNTPIPALRTQITYTATLKGND